MIPARETLRAAYDAVIEQIDRSRASQQLTSAFYSKVGDAIFDTCYRAVEHSEAAKAGVKIPKALKVVSAPMGAGKTTFTLAFITALVQLGEHDPEAPRGCVLVVEQMTKADEMYRELSALLPGKVAVWSTDHDVNCKTPTKVLKPAARFHVSDLEKHQVAIVTHAFYKGKRGSQARNVLDVTSEAIPRALTIIDEQTDDVAVFDVTLSGAVQVFEAVQQDERSREAVVPYVQALVEFMTKKLSGGNLEKPSDDPKAWTGAALELEWFTTTAARDYERDRKRDIQGLEGVFSFARALTTTQAFVTRYGNDTPHFVGYDLRLELCPGMVLLDATADIDGITALCPWRSQVNVPASYANLSIVHVPCFTRQRLSTYVKQVKNRRAYVSWMRQTILAHTEPGQRALVVCKKSLFDNGNIPDWPEGDLRFDRPETYQLEYGWDIEGRKLCTTHWGGLGIGVNHWREADVVFLFGEFHQPRRVTVARAQGLMAAKATEGPLAAMKTLNSKSPHVDKLRDGHLLRWTKQMALRGKGRNFDEHGVCAHQKVVCAGNADQFERLVANAAELFPGADITTEARTHATTEGTYAEKFLAALSTPGLPDSVSTKWIGEQVGALWSHWGRRRARTASGCDRAGHARPSRSQSRRSAGRPRGSSRIGRPLPARSSAGHRPRPSLARAHWPIAWRNDAQHRSRRHSHAHAVPRRSGSTSAARGQPSPHCSPATHRVLLSTAPASVSAGPHVHTRTTSLPIARSCGPCSGTPLGPGRSP